MTQNGLRLCALTSVVLDFKRDIFIYIKLTLKLSGNGKSERTHFRNMWKLNRTAKIKVAHFTEEKRCAPPYTILQLSCCLDRFSISSKL